MVDAGADCDPQSDVFGAGRTVEAGVARAVRWGGSAGGRGYRRARPFSRGCHRVIGRGGGCGGCGGGGSCGRWSLI